MTESTEREANTMALHKPLAKECKWFAGLVELEYGGFNKLAGFSIGSVRKSKMSGKLFRVDLVRDGRAYAVIFKAGSACKGMAEKEATKYGGFVEVVTGKYMFNNSDIKQDRL